MQKLDINIARTTSRKAGSSAGSNAGLKLLAQILCALVLVVCASVSQAGISDVFRKTTPEVLVADPFLEMHTGPGRGYPVFYVAGEGETIKILKRRTDWFKVELRRGESRIKRGWVPLRQMRATLDLTGEPIDFPGTERGDFETRKWEMGFGVGDFDGARTIDGFLAYGVTPNISLRLSGTQILGNFSDGLIGTVNVVLYPFPEWRVSPYFTVGTGIIHTEPQTTVVQAEDRTDEIVNAGLGANIYLTRRFVMNFEYRRHTVLTSQDDNQEINEWKAGFSVFLGKH